MSVDLSDGYQTYCALLTHSFSLVSNALLFNDQGKVAHNRLTEGAQYAARKESRFVFEQTTMTEIARLLENNYSLTVKIPSAELATQTISGSFKAKD